MLSMLSAITGQEFDKSEFVKTGERVFNLRMDTETTRPGESKLKLTFRTQLPG